LEKLRVAIIGAGQIARVSHIANYQSREEVEVVAVCDTNLEAAANVASQFHIPEYFQDHITMIEKVRPDAVSICIPNKFHARVTCDALELGCHVLCEKPPALTVEEARLMEAKAKSNQRLLTFGFHFRYGENVRLVKTKIDHGDFGSIYNAKVVWTRRRGIPGWGNFINKDLQGGGPLIDIGSHILDLAAYLLDYPEIDYVCATAHDNIGKNGSGIGFMGRWDPERFTVEDSLFGFIRFKNGSSINLETSFALNMKDKDCRNLYLYGDKLGASVFPLELYGEEYSQMMNSTYLYDDAKDLHAAEVDNFVNACLGKEELLITPKQAVYIQTLICALYESAQQGKPVSIIPGDGLI
jgi:predicted dehydrogenase